LEEGMPEGLKGFKRGFGTPSIKEFTTQITIFNCVEPLHPTLPTAEVDIVIKTFEVQLGIAFVESLLRITNSLQSQFDTSDAQYFSEILTINKSQ